MRRLSFAFLLLVAGAGVAIVQPLQDPWHRPLSPTGSSAGITYGTVAPSLASTGTNPGQGEVWMDTDGATDGGPIMQVYDHVSDAWDAVLNSAALTANTIPVFNGLELIDSTVTDDATDVLATGGLFTAGTALLAANSILLDGNNGELIFEGGTADGGEIIFTSTDPATDLTITFDNPAANSGGTWITVAGALAAQDAGDIWIGLHIDLDSPADHNGAAVIRGIEVDNDAATATGEETGLHFTTGWDAEIHFADATATLWWLETGNFTLQDYGGEMQFILEDVPDLTGVDATAALVEVDATPGILDAGDILHVVSIDINGVANHTGGDVIALDINQQTNDAQSNDVGIAFNDRFDTHIVFNDATADMRYANTGELEISDTGGATSFHFRDVPAAGTGADLLELDTALTAMDGAGDLLRSFYINIANADHTNGFMYAGYFDNDTNDADAFEGGLYINGGFDGHLILEAAAASPADNPPASTIALYIDDQTDWSGGGGNDCALIAKDSGGATDIVATLVLNGACP